MFNNVDYDIGVITYLISFFFSSLYLALALHFLIHTYYPDCLPFLCLLLTIHHWCLLFIHPHHIPSTCLFRYYLPSRLFTPCTFLSRLSPHLTPHLTPHLLIFLSHPDLFYLSPATIWRNWVPIMTFVDYTTTVTSTLFAFPSVMTTTYLPTTYLSIFRLIYRPRIMRHDWLFYLLVYIYLSCYESVRSILPAIVIFHCIRV